MKNNIFLPTNVMRVSLALSIIAFTLSSCEDTSYLDIDAANHKPLSAKVKFINALPSNKALQFWDFTRQVTSVAVQRSTATDYLDTQFGKVQFNITEGKNTSYIASYVFGGSANFVRERGTPSSGADYSGPNGPIADFYHTLIAAERLTVSKRNPGNIDTLILVYDDLTPPAAGKAKVRFANFSKSNAEVDFTYGEGNVLFSHVKYGTFAGQVHIPYDASGKSPALIEGLSWQALAPYKEIEVSSTADLDIFDSESIGRTSVYKLEDIALEAGKIYTIFLGGQGANLKITVLTH